MGGFATVRASFPHPIEKKVFIEFLTEYRGWKGVKRPPMVASEFTQPRASLFDHLSTNTKVSHGAQEPTDRGQWVRSELFRNALRAQGF